MRARDGHGHVWSPRKKEDMCVGKGRACIVFDGLAWMKSLCSLYCRSPEWQNTASSIFDTVNGAHQKWAKCCWWYFFIWKTKKRHQISATSGNPPKKSTYMKMNNSWTLEIHLHLSLFIYIYFHLRSLKFVFLFASSTSFTVFTVKADT